MDYTICNHEKLFENLIAILGRHSSERGAIEALEYLKSAKTNYSQRSIDHMLSCLVLTLDELFVHPPSRELRDELGAAMRQFVTELSEAGSRLARLSRQYEESGAKQLSSEEILAEVDERRGTFR